MNSGKLLVIGKNWPEPLATAAGGRMVQLLSCFKGAGYEITFATTAQPTALSDELGEYLNATRQIRLNDNAFDAWLEKLQPDVVLFDRFMTEEQFGWRVAGQAPSAVRVLDTEDLHSLRLVREEALAKNAPFDKKDWLKHDCTLRELASMYRTDISLVISKYEMRLLSDVSGTDNRLLLHVPFMYEPVDCNAMMPYDKREGFIFIGNGLHNPNTDAIQWLREAIWPLIRQELPHVSIDICGAYLPQKIQELQDPEQGFRIRGWVENANAIMEKAKVQLAPLRYGAGIKGKLTTAMVCGTPSVTTTIGAEGMHDNLPWAGSIADEPAMFASEAVRLYQDAQAWGDAQRRGEVIINTLHSKSNHCSSLIAAVAALRSDLETHRAGNVVGAILQRDSQASTKYMSRWIEVKNALKQTT